MKLYLSGPITQSPSGGKGDFAAMADRLRRMGYDVVSPTELDEPGHKCAPLNIGGGPVLCFGPDRCSVCGEVLPGEPNWQDCMKRDVRSLVDCDAIVVVPNWVYSKGAVIEIQLARDLGIQVLDDKLKPFHEPITREAERLVMGPRQEDYDNPSRNAALTADLFTLYLRGKGYLKDGAELAPADYPYMMILVKMAREMHRPKRDGRVDIAGYALVADRIVEGW